MNLSLRGFCRLVSCAASSICDVCESRHDHHGDSDGAADESKVRRIFHWGVRNRQLTLSTSFPEWTGAAHPISDASSTGPARWVVFSGRGSFTASAARCRIRSINQQPHPQTLRSVASFVVGSVGRQMPMLLRQRTAKGLMSPLRQAIFFLASMAAHVHRRRHCPAHADSLQVVCFHPVPARCG